MPSPARPSVPSVSSWKEIQFQPIVGWNELADYVASRTPAPHRSPDSLRLAFWSGGVCIRAVRHGQKMIFDLKSADSWIRQLNKKFRKGDSTTGNEK